MSENLTNEANVVSESDDRQGVQVSDEPAELNLGVLLFLPYRAMEARVLAALTASGRDDITLAQARIFQRIGSRGTRLTDLAQQAQVTKQTAGFLVDQLERAGYVTRRADPTDARARLVCITEQGMAATREAAAVVRQVEREWANHLGPERLAQLRAALVSLREITDPFRDDPGEETHDGAAPFSPESTGPSSATNPTSVRLRRSSAPSTSRRIH